jgi:hypothetical protein
MEKCKMNGISASRMREQLHADFGGAVFDRRESVTFMVRGGDVRPHHVLWRSRREAPTFKAGRMSLLTPAPTNRRTITPEIPEGGWAEISDFEWK